MLSNIFMSFPSSGHPYSSDQIIINSPRVNLLAPVYGLYSQGWSLVGLVQISRYFLSLFILLGLRYPCTHVVGNC